MILRMQSLIDIRQFDKIRMIKGIIEKWLFIQSIEICIQNLLWNPFNQVNAKNRLLCIFHFSDFSLSFRLPYL